MWVVFLLGLVIGTLLGAAKTKNELRALAIKANVAEYVVDPETGDVEFTFKKMGENQ